MAAFSPPQHRGDYRRDQDDPSDDGNLCSKPKKDQPYEGDNQPPHELFPEEQTSTLSSTSCLGSVKLRLALGLLGLPKRTLRFCSLRGFFFLLQLSSLGFASLVLRLGDALHILGRSSGSLRRYPRTGRIAVNTRRVIEHQMVTAGHRHRVDGGAPEAPR
uniref:Putative transmembrane protein n=1 Tax=Rhodococcus sp. NS1 TaxID=402236 RepID=Q06GC2_9NOCA|nr:putative transmembrane protein [Rhodococcus sp. NS1]